MTFGKAITKGAQGLGKQLGHHLTNFAKGTNYLGKTLGNMESVYAKGKAWAIKHDPSSGLIRAAINEAELSPLGRAIGRADVLAHGILDKTKLAIGRAEQTTNAIRSTKGDKLLRSFLHG